MVRVNYVMNHFQDQLFLYIHRLSLLNGAQTRHESPIKNTKVTLFHSELMSIYELPIDLSFLGLLPIQTTPNPRNLTVT